MTRNRKRKIFRIFAGLKRGVYSVVDYGDGSAGIIEGGVGVVEYWSVQYRQRVIEPLVSSEMGAEGIYLEGVKMDEEAKRLAAEYTGEAYSFDPFEVVSTPNGNGVFLAYDGESRANSIVEKGGLTMTLPTKLLSKLKN